MNSLWELSVQRPTYSALEEDVQTDVLVIGGGMAGVLAARTLAERGVDCLLVEADRIGSGTTRGTTAVLTAQHGALYDGLIRRFGAERARLYLEANLRAVRRFRALSQDIPCDFEDADSYLYSTTDARTLQKEAAAVRSLGFPAHFVSHTDLPFPVAGAVVFPGMAQFHPLKFLYGAAQGLRIYENTQVLHLEDGLAVTRGGRIRANRIVAATHFPLLNKRGLYFMKLYQKRSFVLALRGVPSLQGTYADPKEGGIYLRGYDGMVVVGGGDHRTGRKGGGFAAVEEFVRRHYPDAEVAARWAAQDCMSLDSVPYIGPYSPSTPNLYVATGFNEWGMTSSMVAARILADGLTGRPNPFAAAFTTDRSMLRPQLFANLGATAVDYLTPTAPRCSHMGCALKWNAAEHSWDCPCHGSRFDGEGGGLLDNPALHGIRR